LIKTTKCGRIYNFFEEDMKAKVYVTLKPSVLDPQGKAIHHSVELMGYEKIADVRQGKYFEIALDNSLSEADAKQAVEKIAKDVLANPVIEDYRVEVVNN
jgi:phosphoribosylformylglycinamidine synthase PurS subunit